MRWARLVLILTALAAAAALLVGCTGDDSSASAEPAPAAAPAPADVAAEPAAPAEALSAEPAPAAPPPPAADPAPATAPAEEPPPRPADELAPLDTPGTNATGETAVESALLVSNSLVSEGPRVIRTAEMAIWVEPGTFDLTIDRTRLIASGVLGFVTNSSRQVYDEKTELVNGSITVRVPGERYARVMQLLTNLGTVEGRTERGEDVSRKFVDLEARRRHLEAVELRMLGFLDETKTIRQALTVQARVNDVQLQLEQIRGQLRLLDDQTSFSTITVAVTERDPVAVAEAQAKAEEKARLAREAEERKEARAKAAALAAGEPDDPWGPLDAWRVAVDGFLAVIGGAFVVLATAGPIMAVLLAAFVAWRLIRRRRAGENGAPASSGAA